VQVDELVDLTPQTAILIFIDPFRDLKIEIAVEYRRQGS
jgi:hypothetical protein